MTTPTLTPHSADDAPKDHGRKRALPGLRGLPWSVLRVHRVSLWVWTAFVVLASGLLLLLHARIPEIEQAERSACGASPCEQAQFPLWQLDLMAPVVAYLPFAVAVYAGGALIGRELESGTDRLAFTQSVPPMRWLAAQLAVPALLITVGTTVITGLFRWVWLSSPRNNVGGWYESDFFHAMGAVGPAYVLLGLVLGALAGLLARRTLPGMGLALAFVLTVYGAGNALRFMLWPRTVLTGDQVDNIPETARHFGSFEAMSISPRADRLCAHAESSAGLDKCLDKYGTVTERSAEIIPVSQYWPMQLVEGGIVLVTAALAAIAAFWLFRRRLP